MAYNKASHGGVFLTAASPPLQSRACWQLLDKKSGSINDQL
tara:strand:+ start:136 stop:258 length:123 start_codon:yes stop_codon:yes gene_type:complete